MSNFLLSTFVPGKSGVGNTYGVLGSGCGDLLVWEAQISSPQWLPSGIYSVAMHRVFDFYLADGSELSGESSLRTGGNYRTVKKPRQT